MAEWYEKAFNAEYLEVYDQFEQEPIWQMDCDFIARQLELQPGDKVLDLCCGAGRHAAEFARRGMDVTGLDASDSLLGVARERCEGTPLQVNWVHADARSMEFDREFDAAYNYFTSFGYNDHAGNVKVVEKTFRALKPGGRVLLEMINMIWLLGNFTKVERRVYDKFTYVEKRTYNARTGRVEMQRERVLPDGTIQQLEPFSVRIYLPSGLVQMFEDAGFEVGDFVASPSGQPFDPFATPRLAFVARRPL